MTEPVNEESMIIAGSGGDDQAIVDRIAQRFISLEESNKTLSADVRALAKTLEVVNELQIKQRENERKQAEVDKTITLEKQQRDTQLANTRKRINNAWVGLSILLAVASIGVYLILLNRVNTLLDENSHDRRAACDSRNSGTLADVERERLLAKSELDLKLKKIHSDSADQIARSVIDCDRLYPSMK